MIHSASPAGPHTSQPDLTVGYKVFDKTGYCSYNYFVTVEDDKAVFSIPGDTRSVCIHLPVCIP
jgi:hypothetical protein